MRNPKLGVNSMKSDYDVPSLQYALRKCGYLTRLWALIKPYWFSEDRW